MLQGTIHNDDVKRIMLCAKNRRCESPDSLRSKRFRLVSEQRKTGFARARNETRAPPRSFTCTIFRAVFDSRSSFFAPKQHGNACYAS